MGHFNQRLVHRVQFIVACTVYLGNFFIMEKAFVQGKETFIQFSGLDDKRFELFDKCFRLVPFKPTGFVSDFLSL